jgi:hypothetical protein
VWLKFFGTDFESVAKMFLSKKYNAMNICTAAALWFLRKMRNDLCFQGIKWRGVHEQIVEKCARC